MSYPCDFETETDVNIDAEVILDYVKDNQEWFLNRLGKIVNSNEVASLEQKIENIIDKFDHIRRYRDYSSETRKEHASEIELYESLLNVREMIYKLN